MNHVKSFPLFFAGMGLAILGPMAQRGIAQSQVISPFLPPNSAGGAAGGQGEAGGLELRGIMTTAQGTRYCIYDPAKKISSWVAANQSGFGFIIQSADIKHDTVIVNQDGRRLTLALRDAKVAVGLGTPIAGPTVAGGVNIQPSLLGSMPTPVLRPTPEDEQKRLQAIAEEVRRRRLLRGQEPPPETPGAPAPRQQ
jgi:hypothetical protein